MDDTRDRLQEFLDEDRVRVPAEALEFLALMGALHHQASRRGLKETSRHLRRAQQVAQWEMRRIGADELAPSGLTRRT